MSEIKALFDKSVIPKHAYDPVDDQPARSYAVCKFCREAGVPDEEQGYPLELRKIIDEEIERRGGIEAL